MTWEYKIGRPDRDTPPADWLNRLGRDHWELVAFHMPDHGRGLSDATYVFKRERIQGVRL